MTDLISTLGNLIASLGNAQSATVLKEHVAFMKTQLDLIAKRITELEKENAKLRKQNIELKQELERYCVPDQYIEYKGALFKRKPSGNELIESPVCPVCPVCHSAMVSFQKVMPYKCGNQSCKQRADFCGKDLPDIINELNGMI